MQTSLASLVENLKPQDFKIICEYFAIEKVSLLTRKGFYPYDYVGSIDKLTDEQLPPKEAFYSKLNDEEITDMEYQRTHHV